MMPGESGIDWPTIRLKHLFREVDRRVQTGTEQLPLLSVSIHRGVLPRAEMTDRESRADDFVGYKIVRAGDLVINRMRAFEGGAGIACVSGMVSADYAVIRTTSRLDPRYLHHLIRSSWFVGEMTARLRGIGSSDLGNVRTPRINVEDLGTIEIRLPPTQTQRAIAEYLDAESARIDEVVTAMRSHVDVLGERRRVVVSRSLEDATDMRVPVRRVVSMVTSGPRGWASHETDSPGSPFLRISNVSRESIYLNLDEVAYVEAPRGEEADRCRVQRGDVLTTITAAIGQVGIVPEAISGAYISQHLALLRPNRETVSSLWLALALWSGEAQRQLDEARYGGTKQQLSLEDIRDVRIPLPRLDVQHAVLTNVLQQLEHLGGVRDMRARQIDQLLERRQALITAAVTGQTEIPGVAA